MRPCCRGGQPDVDQLVQLQLPILGSAAGFGRARAAARTKQGVLPPEEAMRQFRIVHLRSLSMADDYADARPRPALTIFRSVATEAP